MVSAESSWLRKVVTSEGTHESLASSNTRRLLHRLLVLSQQSSRKLTPYRRLYVIHVVNLIVKFEIVVHIVRSDNFDPHPALTEKFYLLGTLPSQYSCGVAQQWRWRSEINRR